MDIYEVKIWIATHFFSVTCGPSLQSDHGTFSTILDSASYHLGAQMAKTSLRAKPMAPRTKGNPLELSQGPRRKLGMIEKVSEGMDQQAHGGATEDRGDEPAKRTFADPGDGLAANVDTDQCGGRER